MHKRTKQPSNGIFINGTLCMCVFVCFVFVCALPPNEIQYHFPFTLISSSVYLAEMKLSSTFSSTNNDGTQCIHKIYDVKNVNDFLCSSRRAHLYLYAIPTILSIPFETIHIYNHSTNNPLTKFIFKCLSLRITFKL